MSAHGKPGHGAKCSCAECRTERRLYKRRYRARARGLEPPDPVPAAPDDPVAAPVVPLVGRVELAVVAEVEMIGDAVERRPALVASAIAMGRVLDDWRLVTTWPSAQRRLQAALDELHAASAPNTGKLATVAALSARKPKPNGR